MNSVVEPTIYVMSDGTGDTVEKIVKASLIQFPTKKAKVFRFKSIRSKEQAEAIIEEASTRHALVVHTIVLGEVRDALHLRAKELKVQVVDLLYPVLQQFSQFLGESPSMKAGILHQVNEEYFKRIEAIEFTVKHDDGLNVENLQKADIILVGVSRTSKTPLSIYLSHRGWKVANYPLVKGIEPAPMLFEIDQSKIMGLMIDSEALAKIRRERLVRMGRNPSEDYASLTHIREEIEWARELYRRNRRWAVFDVTNKALEEIASEIERRIQSKVTF